MIYVIKLPELAHWVTLSCALTDIALEISS